MPEQPVFRGVSQVTIDAKGRMAMPSKYRLLLQKFCNGDLVITADRDGCLLIYPRSVWLDKVEPELMRLPVFNKQARFVQRITLGHAAECEMNSQGRILLPLPLREFAHMNKRAVLMGQGCKFELWDCERWNRQRDLWLEKESDTSEVHEVLGSIRF